jgi:hypothetical protein
LKGKNHPLYRNGERIKEVEAQHREASKIHLTLRDIGDYINMLNGDYPRGRKPNGYIKYDRSDPI